MLPAWAVSVTAAYSFDGLTSGGREWDSDFAHTSTSGLWQAEEVKRLEKQKDMCPKEWRGSLWWFDKGRVWLEWMR